MICLFVFCDILCCVTYGLFVVFCCMTLLLVAGNGKHIFINKMVCSQYQEQRGGERARLVFVLCFFCCGVSCVCFLFWCDLCVFFCEITYVCFFFFCGMPCAFHVCILCGMTCVFCFLVGLACVLFVLFQRYDFFAFFCVPSAKTQKENINVSLEKWSSSRLT